MNSKFLLFFYNCGERSESTPAGQRKGKARVSQRALQGFPSRPVLRSTCSGRAVRPFRSRPVCSGSSVSRLFLPFPFLKNPPVISFRLTTAAIALIFYREPGLNSGDDTTAVRTPGAGLKHDAVRCTCCLNSASAYDRTITTIQCPAYGSAESLTASQLQTGDYTDPQKKNLQQPEKIREIPLKP